MRLIKLNKKGYYFTLDVIIASFVLTIGFILLFLFIFQSPSHERAYQEANNLNIFFSETTNIQAAVIDYVWEGLHNGNITREDYTLWEQIGWFEINNQTNKSRAFIGNITAGLLRPRMGVEFALDGKVLWKNKDDKRNATVVIGRKYMFILTNKTKVMGPFIGEVRVWQ